MPADLEELNAKIQALSPADRLRLAAGLLDAGSSKLAHALAERIVLELGAKLALEKLGEKG